MADSIAAKEEFKASSERFHHGTEHLVGRESELARLDEAWANQNTHVITLVTWGGAGKSSLVAHWMVFLAKDGWRGAQRVFDWSFHSQGTREQGAASDLFIARRSSSLATRTRRKAAPGTGAKGWLDWLPSTSRFLY